MNTAPSQMTSPHLTLVAKMVKNPLAIWEIWVPSLGWEDPLEEGMATHSSILAWWTPWIEETGGQQSMGHKERLSTHTLEYFVQSSLPYLPAFLIP